LRKSRLISAIFYMAVVSAVIFAPNCSSKLEGQGQSGSKDSPDSKSFNSKKMLGDQGGLADAVPVEALRPWRTDLSSYVFGNAHIEALRQVDIVARVDGLLEHLAVEEGDMVRQGQVLAELDKSALTLALREASAKMENTSRIYERNLEMIKKELTSQEELASSKFEYETAQTQRDRANLNLEYATITAPFSGIITKRMVERGDMIRANMVLFNLADTEKLRARVYVPEKEMARIAEGSQVLISSEMFPGEQFSGEVEMIAPVVDPTTGTIKITVQVTEHRNKLKPGMFCTVHIHAATHQNILVISRKALIPDTESPEVYVIDDSSLVHRRKISLGLEKGDTLEIVGGLKENDQVVFIGQENLHEGMKIKVVSGEQETAVTQPTAAESVPPPAGKKKNVLERIFN
jgi:membrane fusion protein (multidrug efflux system)